VRAAALPLPLPKWRGDTPNIQSTLLGAHSCGYVNDCAGYPPGAEVVAAGDVAALGVGVTVGL
jgi:hypothetical protein